MTRFERFKSMSTEEIGEYLESYSYTICDNYDDCHLCPLNLGSGVICNKNGFVEWLSEETGEVDERVYK